MPRIFDNIETKLLADLSQAIQASYRADFCVGYFNLRGWRRVADLIDPWPGGDGHCVRLLVGMNTMPRDILREQYSFGPSGDLDRQKIVRMKKKLAEDFRNQLTIGTPTNADLVALQNLANQIRAGKVVVKLFLEYPLHAKLYLLHREDHFNPVIGYVGSSNLTLAGLSGQGELNVDVVEHDAALKLSKWFDDRWNEWGCVDISEDLVEIIEQSWARSEDIPPYHIYIKLAFHLSQEARAGLSEFRIPRDFGKRMFPYQTAAVKIAARHLNKRGGVLIGDVVGLGKTLMATAVARIFEDDYGIETLIICPKNLVSMWEKYCDQYHMRAKIVPISQVLNKLANLPRFRLIILDESHNLRNREGKRYKAIREYVEKNESMCILLSATPYNKTYLDLSNQLRLFVPEDKDLGIKPERLLRDIGETEFIRQHQCSLRSLAAFEKSDYPDDWRELMRLYMVRRTRSFIMQNYALEDPSNGRKYLEFEDGTRSYFPKRIPRTIRFHLDDTDQLSKLYSDEVVDVINSLSLPRYGLGNYISFNKAKNAPPAVSLILQNLSRAGKRLMGFCRTNLFKRLESSGAVFIQSVERHIMRNFIFLYALENNLPLPIGTQDTVLLDTRVSDVDVDSLQFFDLPDEDELPDEMFDNQAPSDYGILPRTEDDFRLSAKEVYASYAGPLAGKFDWIPSEYFLPSLKKRLFEDSFELIQILQSCGSWDWRKDTKLQQLLNLIQEKHPDQKVLIFTQFADTVSYINDCFALSDIDRAAGVAGGISDPTAIANRFSPNSNDMCKFIRPEQELRVLVATDILSEGQNLQDAHIVVNYDLPWAIVRLIQRAGRVDRIGQKSDEILCYSFLPAEGVERILRLRSRVTQRLKENAEVVGTDESFFEEDDAPQVITDLYNEKSGILDGDEDADVDLSSYAFQIWKNAITKDPPLAKVIENLPEMVFSSKSHVPAPQWPNGVLVYVKTSNGNDSLAWVNQAGKSVSQSQFDILRAAECSPDTPCVEIQDNHHEWVRSGVVDILESEEGVGGQLGRPSGARFKTYERLKHYINFGNNPLFITDELKRAFQDIYDYPLRESAKNILNRQLRSGIQDMQLAELVVNLRAEDRLTVPPSDKIDTEPRIICSLGLAPNEDGVN